MLDWMAHPTSNDCRKIECWCYTQCVANELKVQKLHALTRLDALNAVKAPHALGNPGAEFDDDIL
jgi:hypothetical protein